MREGHDDHPHHSLRSAPPRDVLIHPGGAGTRALAKDPDHLDWIRRQREATPLITSVCTGSLVLAAAGLLSGRPATTHWRSLKHLTTLDPTIEPRPSDRYVDDGEIITAAGVSAGMDMSLHLIQRLAGPQRARQIRRIVQYDPDPPPATDWPPTTDDSAWT
ncbi:DJ-1/PfpI family protein [Nocardia sp. NPDC003482]